MWRSHRVTSEPDGGIDTRWASLPANIWHQPVAGEEDWAVIAFHTASEKDLIDEYQEE
jgi:hypothetical protein